MNTIFAQSSGVGKAGVAVYRLSGPNSITALEKLINSSVSKMKPRSMYFRKIFHPTTYDQIDEAMVVYFNKGSSFTGEESVEIHVHGSLAVIKLLNQALLAIDDLRLAEPGEFTKRAFLNGKFDLTAAEGLADLIEAETELQHKQAIRQLGGGLEEIYNNWRTDLLKIMALLEAYIDFPDEEIPDGVLRDTKANIDHLCEQIKSHLNDNNRGERLRSGLKLAIIGAPNVGKSSLMNYLLKREAAIVSSIAGTTRDIIEGHLDIGGYPIILQDTAGIHANSKDEIEQIGIGKAKKALEEADIKIMMYDGSDAVIARERSDRGNLAKGKASLREDDPTNIIIFNKMDLAPIDTPGILNISVKTGENIDKLMAKIAEIAAKLANPSQNPQITRERHRAQLAKALESLQAFDMDNDLVLAAEEIRMTIRYLSNITGVISVDEILGEIFSNFCIGK
jgi:tRNA modification GTPase